MESMTRVFGSVPAVLESIELSSPLFCDCFGIRNLTFRPNRESPHAHIVESMASASGFEFLEETYALLVLHHETVDELLLALLCQFGILRRS